MPDMGMEEPMGDESMPPMDDPNAEPDMGAEEDSPEGNSQLQKLAGKISQELRDYNQAHPDDEDGMNKYILGMISSAAAGTMKSSDINKIKSNLEGDNETEDEEQPQGDGGMGNVQESRITQMIDEIVNSVCDQPKGHKGPKRDEKKMSRKYEKYKDNPFLSKW